MGEVLKYMGIYAKAKKMKGEPRHTNEHELKGN